MPSVPSTHCDHDIAPFGSWVRGMAALLVLACALLALLGCQRLPWAASPRTPSLSATVSETPVAANGTPQPSLTFPIAASPTASPTPTAAKPRATATARQQITLTLWLPPEMAPDLPSDRPETGALVASQHQIFATEFPTVSLRVMPKMAYGAGGLTDLLLTMAPVVPARLPDVVAIDTSELGLLVAAGLAAPLDELLAPSLWDDLYPFALDAATFDDNLYGLPFQADISFLAYNAGLLETPPRTWDDLLATQATLLLPAAQGDGSAADAFLIHYLARGGRLAKPPLALDSAIAARVLRDYRAALEAGVLPQQVRDLQTLEECWSVYLSGGAAMAHAGSWQYLRDQPLLKRTRFAAIPTPDGETVTVARSWSWVIVTQEAERRQAAARYLTFMADSQWLGQWSIISYHLPTRRSSLNAIQDEAFRAFVEDQLLHASPYPASPVYPQMQAVLARAVEDVLDGITTPERAAISAAAAISRLGP